MGKLGQKQGRKLRGGELQKKRSRKRELWSIFNNSKIRYLRKTPLYWRALRDSRS